MTTWQTSLKPNAGGTEYHRHEGRIVVRRIEWTKPGFKNITSSGWIVEVDGVRVAGAFRTARVAREHTEYPGVAADIARLLAADRT